MGNKLRTGEGSCKGDFITILDERNEVLSVLGDNKLEDVLEKLRDFRDERNWKQFHNLKDLATATAIESAELQEIFLWQKTENIEEFSMRHRKEIKFEIADVLTYILFLCLAMELDPMEAVLEKLEISKRKYPVKKSN